MTSLTLVPAGADVDARKQLYLAEVFGPTIQGEGPSRGKRAIFIRFGGCNLTCSWCDQKETWSKDHGMADTVKPVLTDDVIGYLDARPVPLLVITGGEPLLHQHAIGLSRVLIYAQLHGLDVEFETNGTVVPDLATLGRRPVFNVSPKLANSGVDEKKRLQPVPMAVFSDLARDKRARFKFVTSSLADLDEIAAVVRRFDLPASEVWVMPEGTDPGTVLTRGRYLVDAVLDRGWNFTFRDHILLWRDEKGR